MDLMTLVAKVTIDTKDFERGIATVKTSFEALKGAGEKALSFSDIAQNVGKTFQNIGSTVSEAGKMFAPFSAAATAGLGTAVKVTADFDAQMSKVGAISGATGKEFDGLRDKAREMGATTKFSATEAGQAFEYMAMAGWKPQQMMEGISGVMNLAAASGEDLATTSDIVTDALTAFGMSAKDSGHFADILAAASTSANTNVSMLGESFKYAAPVAGALGISAEDTSVALGVMANSGIKASQAGTALRAGLSNMANPTKQMKEYMDKYGISLQKNADGSINLQATMEHLREKMGNLSTTEQAAAASAIFGKNAMSGWLSIINASDQDFEKLTGAIDNCDGAAEEMANKMNDNLSGQLTILKSQLQELAISIGDAVIPKLREFISFIQDVVDKFNNLDDSQKDMIATIGLVVAAIAPVLLIGGKLISGAGTMIIAIGKIVSIGGTLISSLTGIVVAIGPVGIALTALAVAGVAAGVLLYKNWDTVKKKAVQIWTAVKSTISNALDAIKSAVQEKSDAAKTVITNAWNAAKTVVTNVVTAIKTVVSTGWDAIKTVISTVGNAIKTVLTTLWNAYKTLITTEMNGIKTIITTVWNAIKTVISTVLGAIKSVITTYVNGWKTIISTVLGAIKTVVSTGWNAIKTTILNVVTSLKSSLQSKWNEIKQQVNSAFAASNFVEVGKNIVSGIISGISKKASDLFNALKNLASEALSAAKKKLKSNSPSKLFRDEVGQWIPAGIAVGIEQNTDSVMSAIDDMIDEMVPKVDFENERFSLNSNSSSNGKSGQSITDVGGVIINVYGAPGQDINDLADIIARKINQDVYRNQAVWGMA